MSNVSVFTNEIKECFTILQQQQVIIKQIKSLINYNETDLVNDFGNINTNINEINAKLTTNINDINNKLSIIDNNISSLENKIETLETKLSNILNQLTTSELKLSENETEYSLHATESDGFYLYKGSDMLAHFNPQSRQVKLFEGNKTTIPNDLSCNGKVYLNRGCQVFDTMGYEVEYELSYSGSYSSDFNINFNVTLGNYVPLTDIITDPIMNDNTLTSYTYTIDSSNYPLIVKALYSDGIVIRCKTSTTNPISVYCKKLSGLNGSMDTNGSLGIHGVYLVPVYDYVQPSVSTSVYCYKIVEIFINTRFNTIPIQLSDCKLVMRECAYIPYKFIGSIE